MTHLRSVQKSLPSTNIFDTSYATCCNLFILELVLCCGLDDNNRCTDHIVLVSCSGLTIGIPIRSHNRCTDHTIVLVSQ